MSLCQSCGMPIDSDELKGTNADESLNQEYCTYCYHKGKFTILCTMDEMIAHCVSFFDRFNVGADNKINREAAINKMKEFFFTLKRWSKT